MTQTELSALLRDCLKLWEAEGRVTAQAGGLMIIRAEGRYTITRGPVPTRWFLQTPARAASGRPARPAPSITALLTALRAALDIAAGTSARIGLGARMTSGSDGTK